MRIKPVNCPDGREMTLPQVAQLFRIRGRVPGFDVVSSSIKVTLRIE
jgi:hypothetical protein